MGVGVGRCDLVQFHCFVEIGTDFGLGFPESSGKDVFENSAVASKRSGMGDATSHDAGADDGNRLDRRHLLVRLLEISNTGIE